MNCKIQNKLIITGLPRTGTTFLAATLTELGLNTGYTKKKARQVMEANYGALEYLRDFRKKIARDCEKNEDNTPQIIKHPSSKEIDLILPICRKQGWIVNHVLVTFRIFDYIVASNIARKEQKGKISLEKEKLNKEKEIRKLYPFLFGKIVLDVLTNNYPHTFIEFPKLIEDADYCFKCIKPFLKRKSYNYFLDIHHKFADLNKVHFK